MPARNVVRAAADGTHETVAAPRVYYDVGNFGPILFLSLHSHGCIEDRGREVSFLAWTAGRSSASTGTVNGVARLQSGSRLCKMLHTGPDQLVPCRVALTRAKRESQEPSSEMARLPLHNGAAMGREPGDLACDPPPGTPVGVASGATLSAPLTQRRPATAPREQSIASAVFGDLTIAAAAPSAVASLGIL